MRLPQVQQKAPGPKGPLWRYSKNASGGTRNLRLFSDGHRAPLCLSRIKYYIHACHSDPLRSFLAQFCRAWQPDPKGLRRNHAAQRWRCCSLEQPVESVERGERWENWENWESTKSPSHSRSVALPSRYQVVTKSPIPTNIQKATKATCCRSPETFSCCSTK